MAYHGVITLPRAAWGKLTPAGAVLLTAKLTIIPQSNIILLAAQATDVAPGVLPADFAKCLSMGVNMGVIGTTLADLYPGSTGTFLWGYAASGSSVFVSHA